MRIANPIYDIVFKYLMDDNKIAKLLISSIIGEEISELELRPTEGSVELSEHRSLTVYRLDFSAKIKTGDDGYRQVIVEIQKAKLPSDIMRFRKYLGEQYRSKNNVYTEEVGGVENTRALPIIGVYFLGHRLDLAEAPLIGVKREYYDMTTGEVLKGREEFIESLTHDSFVIQIPLLKERRRSDLEKLLGVFDQSSACEGDHVLDIREGDYPKKYWRVIRRLQAAMADSQVRKTMEVEDEIVEDLQNLERRIAQKDKAMEEKDKVIGEKDKVIGEKDKVIEEIKKAMEENKEALSEKDRLIQELMEKLDQGDVKR